jgi:glucose uptake protein GlcU
MPFLLGLVGALVASVLWGSNFVVTKQYDMGDGMHFQLFLCLGIFLVGVMTLVASDQVPHEDVVDFDSFPLPDLRVTLSFEGLLGGAVWCLGNLLTVPVVNRVGLGLGMSVWAGTSLVVSFLFGRVNVLGLVAPALSSPILGLIGVSFAVGALFVFSQVNLSTSPEGMSPVATASVDPSSASDRQNLLNSDEIDDDDHQRAHEHTSDAIASDSILGDTDGDLEALHSSPEGCRTTVVEAFQHKSSAAAQREGLALAVVAGLLYGVMFVPFKIHAQQYPKPPGMSDAVYSTRFFFSQFTGTFLTSVLAFAIYTWSKRNNPTVIAPPAMMPSVLSGMLWATACMGSMLATAELGLSVGYPLSANGSFVVNAVWSLFVFREVESKRDRGLFFLAGGLSIASCLMLSAAA